MCFLVSRWRLAWWGSFSELMFPLSHYGRAASQLLRLKVSSQSQPPASHGRQRYQPNGGSCFTEKSHQLGILRTWGRRSVGNRGIVRNKVLISSSRANPRIGVYRFDQDFQCIKSSPNARGKAEQEDRTGIVTHVR